MVDYFLQDGKKYKLTISIISDTAGQKSLHMEDVDMFSYTNEMNKLYLTGYLEYSDSHGIVDKFVEMQVSELHVDFCRLQSKGDGKVVTWNRAEGVSLKFYIDNVEILANDKSVIKYKLYLISKNWMNLNSNIAITSYSQSSEPKSPTDLIKDILTQYAGMSVNGDSFSKNSSQTRIDYISDINDTVFSSIDYLLSMTAYHQQQLDNSLKTLIVDDSANTVFLFNTKKSGGRLGTFPRPIEIKVLQNDSDINYRTPVYMGYVAKNPKIMSQMDTKTRMYTEFVLKDNKFKTTTMDYTSIQNFFHGKNGGKMSYGISGKIYQKDTFWNHDRKLYGEMFTAMTRTNGLVINQVGEIGTMPGFNCTVSIPSTIFQDINDSKATNANNQLIYQPLTKAWDICKVQHFISPKQGMFRQKLVLYRV